MFGKVEKAARNMDRYDPDWWRRVNPDTIDLTDSYHCVLGQAFQGPGAFLMYGWRFCEGNLPIVFCINSYRRSWRRAIKRRAKQDRRLSPDTVRGINTGDPNREIEAPAPVDIPLEEPEPEQEPVKEPEREPEKVPA